jgi:hypothetical protein
VGTHENDWDWNISLARRAGETVNQQVLVWLANQPSSYGVHENDWDWNISLARRAGETVNQQVLVWLANQPSSYGVLRSCAL